MKNNKKHKRIKIAFLWSGLSNYFSACLKAAVEKYPIDILVFTVSKSHRSGHSFDNSLFSWITPLISLPDGTADQLGIVNEALEEFDPDLLIISGWFLPAYRKAARKYKKNGGYVISGLDNPWLGTFRQIAAARFLKFYLKSFIDTFWVPGERAAVFSKNLGFDGKNLLIGLYSSDSSNLKEIAKWRNSNLSYDNYPRVFLFVGRLESIKGIEDLLLAYQEYRKRSGQPWDLWVAGSGSLSSQLKDIEGLKYLGFIQPNEYIELLKKVGVFVLPSTYDPWPLVIHEATSAGLPILCSRQCGSSVELVQEGHNGFRFDSGDTRHLTSLMLKISDDELDIIKFSQNSQRMAERYSPEGWADILMNHVRDIENV